MNRVAIPSVAKGLIVATLMGLSVSCDSPAAPAPAAVATVVVTPANKTLTSLGDTLPLSAVARDADGNAIEGRNVVWTSDAPNVIAITAAGAEAKAPGLATITATVDGISGSTKLAVEQVVTAVEMTPAALKFDYLGQASRLTAKPKDARGNLVEGKVLAWSSSAPTIVAANTSGGVMAVANGQATITASVDGVTATGVVTVAQVPVKLAFAAGPITTQNGVTMPTIKVQVQDAQGSLIPDAVNPVSIALAANPASGVMSGTTQVTAANGSASFSTLAIDKPGVGYTLTASAAGLDPATSSAFEIMDVPLRVDSVKFAGTSMKIGGSLAYSIFITNGSGKNATLVGVQGYITQGVNNNAAGGASVFGCGSTTAGTMVPGTCRMDWSINATIGTFVAGPATAKLEVREGQAQVLRGTKTLALTMVP